jgi:hypothetical protein
MSKQVYYRQCQLRKNGTDGSYSEQTSYLPEPFCKKGKTLKLRDDAGSWENGWIVIEVSRNRRLEEELPDAHQEIKRHRKATGDALK